MFDFGPREPWIENVAASAGKFESILIGGTTNYDLYKMFSGPQSEGEKPFMVTATASATHLWVHSRSNSTMATRPLNSDSHSRAFIKQNWWRQILNETLLAKYPKIKAVCTFEVVKYEVSAQVTQGISWRDYSIFGSSLNSPFGNDGMELDHETNEFFKKDISGGMGNLIIWGERTFVSEATQNESEKESGSSSSFGCLLLLSILLLRLI